MSAANSPVGVPDPAEVEALAEVLSYATGEFTQYADDAHPDHNRWSWRGDGHGAPTDSNPLRDHLRDAARAVLTSDWLADRDRARDRELGERIEYLTTLNSEQAALIRQAQETLDSCREQRTDLTELVAALEERLATQGERIAAAIGARYDIYRDEGRPDASNYQEGLLDGLGDVLRAEFLEHRQHTERSGVVVCVPCLEPWPCATVTDALAAHVLGLVAAGKAEALREAARYFEYEMAPAWGGDSTWISTGSHVADLVAETLRDRADGLAGEAS